MQTPLTRRAGWTPVQTPAPTPMTPSGVVSVPPAPITETPSATPGILPQVSDTPVYQAAPPLDTPSQAQGWQGALQRALIGFSKGASHVNIDPTYNPVAAGLVGGTEAAGAAQQEALNRRMQLQAAANAPRLAAEAAALKTTYEDAAHKPTKDAENQATLDREMALAKAKGTLPLDDAELETSAQNLADLPLSKWAGVLGRAGGPRREMLYNRATVIRQARGAPSLNEADNANAVDVAGRKAEASGIGNVKGAKGQEIGATAASMNDMLEKAKPLMSDVSPTDSQTFNELYQAGTREFQDPKLLKVDTYLTSAAGFYASLQKNGGVPDPVEREAAKKVLSARLASGGFDAVAQALQDEGASRVKRIKENQNPNAPGSAINAPAAPAAPAAKSTWRHY